jgi:uncharacterized protein (UPF0332 family)
MSFDWSYYLVLAQELFENPTDTAHKREANLRCSISRAYYSTFHHAKHTLDDKWNILVSESVSAHAQIWNFFKQKGERDIAWKLRYMRNARNKADYDDQIANLDKLAKDILKLAGEVIKELSKL